MLIVTQDSEHALMSILDRNDEPSSCLLLGFSRIPAKPDDWFPRTVRAVQQTLEGKSGCMIMRFEDNDVMILARGVGREYLARLASPFSLEAFSLFALPDDREKMKALCRHKIDRKRAEARQTFGTVEDRRRIGEVLRKALDVAHEENEANIMEKMEKNIADKSITPDDLLQYIWNSSYPASKK